MWVYMCYFLFVHAVVKMDFHNIACFRFFKVWMHHFTLACRRAKLSKIKKDHENKVIEIRILFWKLVSQMSYSSLKYTKWFSFLLPSSHPTSTWCSLCILFCVMPLFCWFYGSTKTVHQSLCKNNVRLMCFSL